MATSLRLSAAVREQLHAAMVEESALVQALRQARGERVPGQDEVVRTRCALPARRPLDPEFVQMVEVDVLLRRTGDAWEVVEVQGLELPEP
jgi:hypothetical protein